MSDMDDALIILRQLGRRHGRVLSLSLVFKTFLQTRIYDSKEAIADCLRSLQRQNKIKPINFGVDIELLEDAEDLDGEEYVQSSLSGFGRIGLNGLRKNA